MQHDVMRQCCTYCNKYTETAMLTIGIAKAPYCIACLRKLAQDIKERIEALCEKGKYINVGV